MIKAINHDQNSLQQISQPASQNDRQVGRDLADTLAAHHDHCVGMAANMINVHKRIIAVSMGPVDVVMFNPVITAKSQPYQTKEGCLSLTGERPAKRYKRIELDYRDMDWHKRHITLTAFTAEIVQHEIDHCDGILI
ncbi:peptide deformylase [Limosilactobacillus sp.]|uniref:peptide deformylase n=1 Tax=Limosilactobacillus sp. TaxID=2773925 RepID=UPI00345E7A96